MDSEIGCDDSDENSASHVDLKLYVIIELLNSDLESRVSGKCFFSSGHKHATV
jgi:hypothetical protein